MISATRRIQFCAGHRVLRHESKCRNLHGHNYVALFEARGEIDPIGRVIDFGVLKDRLGSWIEREWDHGFLLYREDGEAARALRAMPGQKLALLDFNPTAELLADFLLRDMAPREMADTGVVVVKVTLWETENCMAVASL